MKHIAAIVLFAAAALAGTRSRVSEYAATLPANDPVRVSWERGELLPMRDHLAEPVAWAETTVITTNVVVREAELVEYERQLLGILQLYGVTNIVKGSLAVAMSRANAAAKTNSVAVMHGVNAVALRQQIEAMGASIYDCTGEAVRTNVSESMVITPTAWRWQQFGFTAPPTVADLEKAR